MSSNSPDLGQWIQALTARAAAEQVRSLQRYGELLQRVASGELDMQALQEAYMHFAREETARYTRQLADLSLSYYTELLNLSRGYNDRFFDRLAANATNGNEAAASGADSPQVIDLVLHGAIGQEVSAAFVIENKRTEVAEISFIVSEFSDGQGGAGFRPPMRIEPPRFSLGPRAERAVTLRVPLLAGLFAPGQRYSARIVVSGYDDLQLALSIWTEGPPAAAEVPVQPTVPDEEATRATPPPRPRRPRRKATGSTTNGS